MRRRKSVTLVTDVVNELRNLMPTFYAWISWPLY